MNFLHHHKRVTFPSLFTVSTTDSMDHADGMKNNNSISGDMCAVNDPSIAFTMFQQRVTHYIHNAYCLERSRSNLYHSRIDGTVSTSLVEDIMSLVNAMATALRTYLIALNNDKLTNKKKVQNMKTKNNPNSHNTGNGKQLMTTNEKVHMFLHGIQHIISTLESNQNERSKEMMSWYMNDVDVIELICATMNDSIRLSESIESFISNTIPSMMYALQQQDANDHEKRIRVGAVESRNDSTVQNTTTTIEEAYVTLQQSTNDLIALYSHHILLLSEQISMFLIRNIKIQSTITTDFFTPSWENEWTNNELCRAMIDQYIHKYLLQCQQYLVGTNVYIDDKSSTLDIDNSVELRQQDRNSTRLYHFHKVITNTVRATICLYIRCLIQNKADPMALRDKHSYLGYFQNPERALLRMYDDIRIMKKYFIKQFCNNDHVTLQRIIVDEFSTLELLYECLLCCWSEHLNVSTTASKSIMKKSPTTTTTELVSSSSSSSSLESFIVVIHKRCTKGNAVTTHYLVGDLFVLMSPPTLSTKGQRFRFLHPNHKNMYQERITSIQKALQVLKPDLLLVTSHMKELNDQQNSEPSNVIHKTSDVAAVTVSSYHHLNCMLQSLYDERMTNGILPQLCHSLCLPLSTTDSHDDDDLYDGTNPKELIADLFIHPIRTITRTLRR